VGFLFPHDCHRTTPEGCPDCQNGQIQDPYGMRQDRWGYSRYDYYADNYFFDLVPFYAAGTTEVPNVPDTTSADFTEADGTDLVTPGEEFENNMTES
jgi:hypothetical protein